MSRNVFWTIAILIALAHSGLASYLTFEFGAPIGMGYGVIVGFALGWFIAIAEDAFVEKNRL